MLKPCPECGHNCSDKALSCPSCGYPFISVPLKQTTPKMTRSRMRRLPNGFGSVKHLSGKRRKPYAAYPPVEGYHDNGSPIARPALGYFETYNEAYECLMDYNRNPYNVDKASITFKEVYDFWHKETFTETSHLSDSSKYNAVSAFKKSKPLHDKPYVSLKPDDFQKIIDECDLKKASKKLILNLFKQLGKYAMAHDYVQKDYTKYVKIDVPDDTKKRTPFSMDEIMQIIKNKDHTSLVLLYTGMRISELKTIQKIDENYLKGGLKTKAGKNRIIPIHPAIKNERFNYANFKPYEFRKQFSKRYPGHTPHDLRHTATWLMQTYKCDELATHFILGHTLGPDIEKNTYGHRTQEQLLDEIKKIPDFTISDKLVTKNISVT